MYDPARRPKSTVAWAISEARASLKDPRRPFTPAAMTRARTLFLDDEIDGRFEDELAKLATSVKSLRDDKTPRKLALLQPWVPSAFNYNRRSEGRAAVVRALSAALDNENPEVRLSVARDMLVLVDECELAAAKTLFEASQRPELDDIIVRLKIATVVVTTLSKNAHDNVDALVYLTAFIKNVAGPVEGLPCALCDLLRAAKDARLLVQVTAALRNVCRHTSQLRQLESSRCVSILMTVLNNALGSLHWELVFNVSRCLARLPTEDLDVNLVVNALLAAHKVPSTFSSPIVVRLGFVVGNVTVSERRRALSRVDDLVAALDHEFRRPDPDDDVLTNLVRIVANCAIDADIAGAGVVLIRLLSSLQRRDDELLLHVVAAMANLTYHVLPLFEPAVRDLVDVISRVRHDDTKTEAARALGNLARDAHLRDVIRSYDAIAALTNLVVNKHRREVTLAAVGVLVNLAADPQGTNDSFDLTPVVRRVGLHDLDLAALACKVMYNWLLHGDLPNRRRLRSTLEELIEATTSCGASASDARRTSARDFLAAATALLALLE